MSRAFVVKVLVAVIAIISAVQIMSSDQLQALLRGRRIEALEADMRQLNARFEAFKAEIEKRPPQAIDGGARVYDYLYNKSYHNSHISHEYPVVKLAKDLFPSDKGVELPGWNLRVRRTITIGCSHGRGTAELSKLGFDALGMDVATKAVSLAIERHGNKCSTPPCFRQGALGEKLPFEDASFDMGVSSDVLEHVPTKSVDAGVAEISRVVKHFLALRIANFLEVGKNGEKLGMGNLHVTVQNSKWWAAKFASHGWHLMADFPSGNYVFIVLGRLGSGLSPSEEDATATNKRLLAWFSSAKGPQEKWWR
jgi:2-polyprenyl-3-methyl-5-hydroxy-6-metoxy-1,4-benzoquinol methylase